MFDVNVTKANNAKLNNDILNNKKKLQVDINYNAFYLGIVEDTNDPQGLGRIKARIPAIHGTDKSQSIYLDTASLPWASPALLNGGSNDMGQFIVPIKGSTVYMTFEYNSYNDPIYFGSIPTKIGSTKYYNDNSNIYNGETYDINTNDRITDLDKDSAQTVVYKSFKGATILIDDKDGKESISIIDAAGQQIVMENDSDEPLPRRGNKTLPPSTANIRILTAGSIDMICDEFNVDTKNTTIDTNIATINSEVTNLNSSGSTNLSSDNFTITANSTNIPDYVDDSEIHISIADIRNEVSDLESRVEYKNNKVTSINSGSTHTQYPSAKLLYDTAKDLEIDALTNMDIENLINSVV